MGTKLCNCEGCDNDNNSENKNKKKPKMETNLSKIDRYCYMKESQTLPTLEDEYRTKAGTEWKKIAGLEKIILLYKINFIIKKYREHLNFKKQKEKNDNNDNIN